MAAWYEQSVVKGLRGGVAERLKLPPFQGAKGQEETATQFWLRVERAGLLTKALELYDQLAAQDAAWVHTRRETKGQFEERIEREGRQAEVDCVRVELKKSGLSEREIQAEMVQRFQPVDGSETRSWQTPDPWQAGRLFRNKADQEELLAEASDDDEDDVAAQRACWRVECAKWRRDERNALATARRRARALAGQNAAAASPASV